MVDLIVPAGTVLKIDQASQVAQRYGLFRMEANAKIVSSIDLTIKASRAEFATGCVIDASGAPGAYGNNGAAGGVGANGGSGSNGFTWPERSRCQNRGSAREGRRTDHHH
jgi:hypothetical protein